MTSKGNILKRGKIWYVRIVVDGHETWKSTRSTDRRVAEELLPKVREDEARRVLGLARRPRSTPTLLAFAPKYLTWSKAHKRSHDSDVLFLGTPNANGTMKTKGPILDALGHLRLAELTRARVEAYMRDRKASPTRASARMIARWQADKAEGKPVPKDPPTPRFMGGPSINREAACLRKLLSYAVERGDMETNPLRGIKMFQEAPGRQPILEPTDERRLLKVSPPWFAAVVRLALASGCRQGELTALRWRHVDLDACALSIVDSKSGESRRVPLAPGMVDELRDRRGLPDGFVLTSIKGGQLTMDSVTHSFRTYAGKIGRDDLRFHDLRHVAATRLQKAGAGLPEIATFLGHKTLIMARRYAHTSWDTLSDLVSRMGDAGQVRRGR